MRVSVQRTNGLISVDEAGDALAGMLLALGKRHEFLPDDQPSTPWCLSVPSPTDAHLLELAANHGAQLATLDARIPGAFLLPSRIPN